MGSRFEIKPRIIQLLQAENGSCVNAVEKKHYIRISKSLLWAY